ncbi:MAG: Diacylglycerol kinase [Verrucomicrobiota bacterium]|jgi:diacylglycerol kinase family enzyme
MLLITANPYSGRKANQELIAQLEAELKKAHLPYTLAWDFATAEAAFRGGGLSAVLACGGDGSVAHTLGLMQRCGINGVVPFATLPMGNENLFAKAWGYSRDLPALVQALLRRDTFAADLGFAGESPFTLLVSAGFDGEVVRRLDSWRRSKPQGLHRVSNWSYLPHGFKSFCSYDYPGVTLEAGGEHHHGHQAFVFNLPLYGAGLGFSPRDCRGDDGLFDWVLLKKPGRFAITRLLAGALLGRRHLDHADVVRGRAAEVSLSGNAPVQMDGEPLGPASPKLHLRCLRGASLLIRPL